MKRLNREDYTVIDEFDCNITTIVNVFEEQSGKLIVIDEFGLDITKRVKVIRKQLLTLQNKETKYET